MLTMKQRHKFLIPKGEPKRTYSVAVGVMYPAWPEDQGRVK